MATQYNASIWPPLAFPPAAFIAGGPQIVAIRPFPPMIFPLGTGQTRNGGTFAPGPAPPSVLPQAVSTTVQSTGTSPAPQAVDYPASLAAEAARLARFKIVVPTFPTVTNS